MTRRAPDATARQVALHIGPSPAAAWGEVILPWLRTAAESAFKEPEPTVVVLPHRSRAYELKARLLRENLSLLGVRFVSPPEFRDLLLGGENIRLPLREHLRLLLAIAAEEAMELPDEPAARDQRMLAPEFLAAKSVARAPDHLLRAIDQLSAAGWSFAEFGPAMLREVYSKFQRQVNKCGFELVHEADRKMMSDASSRPPIISKVLICGFNGEHWPLWSALRAGVEAAKQATVVLDDPRDEARDLDEPWIGTWEEIFGEAARISVDPEDSNDRFSEALRPAAPTEKSREFADLHFLIGSNTTEQAQAIVTAAVGYLRNDSCERLGILFSGPGALARMVAAALAELGIEHNDSIAHLAPGPFEDSAWEAWLELQQNRQLDSLLRFLRTIDGERLFRGLGFLRVEEVLRRAYRDVLIDDLTVLAAYCARKTEWGDATAIATGLASLKFLSERSTFADFVSHTREIFSQLGWTERWAEVERLSKNWRDAVDAEFSRSIYLRWLKEITCSVSLLREAIGDHPYSRVHLLRFGDAEGQQWSHLIFAGLNEGNWPPAGIESTFLREEEIESLNARVRGLNRRALRQGSQGEGHVAVLEGKTLCLGPIEQRQIASRQLVNLVAAAEYGLAISASLYREAEPERRWNPSEFFMQLHFGARGSALSQSILEALAQQTRKWVTDAALFVGDSGAPATVQQTRIAYDARRNAFEPADEYDFALRSPLTREVVLSVTQWEKVVSTPALIWMNAFLGVEGGAQNGDMWAAATGQWVHRWLATISGQPASNRFAELPEPNEMRRRVREAARIFRAEVQDLCAVSARTVPDWWFSGWSNALFLADCLAAKLSELREWPRVATEWILDRSQTISLGEDEKLRLRGRIDLILERGDGDEPDIRGKHLWLIDYKTGGRKGLASRRWRTAENRMSGVQKKLVSGEAIQLGLYALAVRELGAADVTLGILSPLVGLDRPQLQLSDITAHSDFWRELHRMQQTGVFGMLGPIRSRWSFANAYPLATLDIDSDILVEKWTRTHPVFGEPPEEEDE